MKLSTLLEWGGILLVFLIVILIVQNIGMFQIPSVSGLGAVQPDMTDVSTECIGLGYGGFYQDYLSSPEPVVRQIGDWTFTIKPVFRYTFTGRIVGQDEYPLTGTDALSPMDVMIANGEILSPAVFPYFTFRKTSRHYQYTFTVPAGAKQVSAQYANEHVSNNHLIFANDTVYALAKSAGTGDFIRISGYLATVTGKSKDGRM